METELNVDIGQDVLTLGTDYVYMQKPYWCNAGFYPLKMSFIRPRRFFPYDREHPPMPVILWITGGGWTEVDNNVWLPELVYYARNGYFIASISYSISPTWVFPESIVEIKQAIRFLKARASEFNIDPERISVAGESAGGYLAAMIGTSGGIKEFDVGEYLDYDSRVKAAVLFYPAIDMCDFEGRGDLRSYDKKPQFLLRGEYEPQSLYSGKLSNRSDPALSERMDPRTYIDGSAPPFMLLHGTDDHQVPVYHSRVMYRALKDAGVEAELLLINGADHASPAFTQNVIKDRVLSFLDRHIS